MSGIGSLMDWLTANPLSALIAVVILVAGFAAWGYYYSTSPAQAKTRAKVATNREDMLARKRAEKD